MKKKKFHPVGTAKIGILDIDPMVVVDPQLWVRELSRLQVVDASVFLTMVTVNPMVKVLCTAERAADLITSDKRWKENKLRLQL